jgi:glycosyltransferase involved in cell wall biosynthesis
MPPLSILIIPVFNDRPSCIFLLAKLREILDSREWRVCIIDDGSTHDPIQLSDLTDSNLEGVILRLPHNVGHQAAIACGVGYAAAQWPNASAVIMDADGEDKPSDIPVLLDRLAPERLSCVVAIRRRRTEGFVFRLFYRIYKVLFRRLTGQSIGFGNFMALSAPAMHRLASMPQIGLNLPAGLIASRIPREEISIDRGVRYFGRSHMNLVALCLHGMRGLMALGDIIFVRLILVGIAFVLAAFASALVALGLKVTGNATPGWFTIVVGLAVIAVIQILEMLAVLLILVSFGRAPRDASRDYLNLVSRIEARY